MKELLTEWRRFLNEEEDVGGGLTVGTGGIDFGKVGKDLEEYTIGELAEIVAQARKDIKDGKETGNTEFALKVAGKFVLAFDPTPATGIAGALKDVMNRANREMVKDLQAAQELAKNHPLLDYLNVDPHLAAKIDKGVLKDLDNRFDEYITALDDDTLVRDIKDVDDFIRDEIEKDTNRNVVIRDENPED